MRYKKYQVVFGLILVVDKQELPMYGEVFRLLMEEGIRIFEWTGPMLHAKTMVVDGVWSAVGSFNLDRWSLLNNLEVSVNLFDPVVGAELQRMFEDDLANCVEITRVGWAARSGRDRLKEWLAMWLAPWL